MVYYETEALFDLCLGALIVAGRNGNQCEIGFLRQYQSTGGSAAGIGAADRASFLPVGLGLGQQQEDGQRFQ
jgi:hypothetical protein